MTSRLENDPKIFLQDGTGDCWEEAASRVLFEFTRACHGALWRYSTSGGEQQEAIENQTEYDKGIEALERFASGLRHDDDRSDLGLSVASILHAVKQIRQDEYLSEVVTCVFDLMSYEATRTVNFCTRCYRESRGKHPAWLLRAATGSAVATIASLLANQVSKEEAIEESGLHDYIKQLLENNVCTSGAGLDVAASAMQVVSATVMNFAAHLVAEQQALPG